MTNDQLEGLLWCALFGKTPWSVVADAFDECGFTEADTLRRHHRRPIVGRRNDVLQPVESSAFSWLCARRNEARLFYANSSEAYRELIGDARSEDAGIEP